MNEWISTKDREPPLNECILVYTKHGETYPIGVAIYRNLRPKFFNPHGCQFNNVTHWMPLPETPNDIKK